MRNGRRITSTIQETILKGKLLRLFLFIALTLSIPVSLFLAAAVGTTVKYETELGHIPSYIDPAEIPKEPNEQKAFQQEIHARLTFTFYILWYWWIPAVLLLGVLFVHSLKSSDTESN